MTRFSRKIAESLIQTLLGDDPEILARINMDCALARVSESCARLPRLIAFTFTLGLWMFGHGLPPFSWRFRNFSRLNAEARERYAVSWADSRFLVKRNLFTLLRVLLLAGALQETALLDWIGYEDARRRRMKGAETASIAPPINGNVVQS